MKEYFDCLIMTHGTAFGVGAAIFLLTILLVSKRIIGFTLSVIFMLIALGASWTINNETFVRKYFDKWIPSSQVSQPGKTSQDPLKDEAPEQAKEKQENLTGQVGAQKERVQSFLDESHPNLNPR